MRSRAHPLAKIPEAGRFAAGSLLGLDRFG